MSKFAVLSLVFFALVAVMVFVSLRGVNAATCDVCITFKGQTECRTGQGRTKEEAIDKARDAACAVMTNGMEEVVRCGSIEPTSTSCD